MLSFLGASKFRNRAVHRKYVDYSVTNYGNPTSNPCSRKGFHSPLVREHISHETSQNKMSHKPSTSPVTQRAGSPKVPRISRVNDRQSKPNDKPSTSTEAKVILSDYDIMKLERKGFRVEKALSSGSCGQLFLMTYRPPDYKDPEGAPSYKMAVKVVDKSTVEENLVKKFLPREIEILSEVDNPHCISVYAMMEMNEKAFFFMRFAENGDLLEYITRHGALPENHGRLWMRQLLLAVDYLDRLGIAHRDIKLENILVTANLNLKLGDFGFARKYLTEDGKEIMCETYCGSLSYAAPEVLEGRPFCPKKVDVWSSGIVMFIMFNLEKPFKRKGAAQLLLAQQAKAYKWTAIGSNKTTDECKRMLDSILEPNAARRPKATHLLQRPWLTADPDIVRYTMEPQKE